MNSIHQDKKHDFVNHRKVLVYCKSSGQLHLFFVFMLITNEHLSQIFSLFNITDETTFGQVQHQFNRLIPKQEHARIVLLLKFCLNDGIFTVAAQQLVVYFLCYYIFQHNHPLLIPCSLSTLLETLYDTNKELRVYQLFIFKVLLDQIHNVSCWAKLCDTCTQMGSLLF